MLTSLPLLRHVVDDLENARNNEECSLTLYFTKESHIHTLVNLVLLSGLPIANRRIPELDYCVRSSSPGVLFCLLIASPALHGSYIRAVTYHVCANLFTCVPCVTDSPGSSCTNAITAGASPTRSTPSDSL